MRHLILLRGAMGSGKSTWIRENELEEYTLSSDKIRLMFQSPVLTETGGYAISGKQDKRVWETLFQTLEERMSRGEFSIIDATHTTVESLNRYKSLAQKYRYRVSLVDFSDVPDEIVLEGNKNRKAYKVVSEAAVLSALSRLKTEPVPKWINVLKPDKFKQKISFKSIDLTHYEKIHHIGDVHGCYTALMKHFKDGLKADELYVFVGDYLDRGIENKEVLEFLLSIYQEKNVIFLEGNHESHLKNHAHGEAITSREFKNFTLPQIKDIPEIEIRQFLRKLRQCLYYTYNGKKVLVTHGGLSKMPDELMFISTSELIKGVGGYEVDIDSAWEKYETECYQIHGHRNLYRLPIRASKNSFNLEGQVEMGKMLRVVTLDKKEGFKVFEYENEIFKNQNQILPTMFKVKDMTVNNFVESLRNHKFIQEKDLGNNLSSFNFTKKAFQEKVWDDINVRARGLFVDIKENEIVAKSYDKFFNINERSFTKINYLADNLKFPVKLYKKYNGYLGILGYSKATGELIFCSKSETRGKFAEWFKELFLKTFTEEQQKKFKSYANSENVSFVFEVVLHEKDPHIIDYSEDKLILLDIISREIEFNKKSDEERLLFARVVDIETKELSHEFHTWQEFYQAFKFFTSEDAVTNKDLAFEGFVIEDSSGFMVKLKLPYYNFWKQMRTIKDQVARNKSIKNGALFTPLHSLFYFWLKEQDKDFIKDENIIKLRRMFFNDESNNNCIK